MAPTPKRTLPIWLILVAGALVMAVAVGAIYTVSRPKTRRDAGPLKLPEGVEQPVSLAQMPPSTQEAYLWAANHYDVLQYIPCYCGCNGAHKNNFECYYKHDNGKITAYDEHALGCQVCAEITMETKKLWEQGKSLPQIRKAIDDMYKAKDLPPTPTPLPPGQ
jgi:hypothetical protein